MASTTAQAIEENAFQLIGVLAEGDTLSAYQAQQGFKLLNQVVRRLSLMPLAIPTVAREPFAMVNGKGSPSNPYTIGPGGDFDTTRPASLEGAGTLVASAPNPFEVPIGLLTDDAYEAIVVKTLGSTYASGIYYNATFDDGLGQIFLYPVPTQANTLILYRGMQLTEFVSLTAVYYFPPVADEVMEYALAKRLATIYGRPWTQELRDEAKDAMAVYLRGNTKMVDLGMDQALTMTGQGVYNILSDGRT